METHAYDAVRANRGGVGLRASEAVVGRAQSTRVNLSIPSSLLREVRARAPGLNLSAVLRDALGQQLQLCSHNDLSCAVCHEALDRREMADAALGAFYDELMARVGDLVYGGDGTAEGAARIMRDVAQRWGVSIADRLPLPRPTRKARSDAMASKLRAIDAHPAAQSSARARARRRAAG